MYSIEQLQELGFSKNEAAVYIVLLGLGMTNVGPIVEETKLHRQLVYEALQNLVDKRLATVVIKNNRKHFQACSPQAIFKQLDQKREIAEEVVPKLLKIQNGAEDRLEAKTLYGQTGFYSNLVDTIESANRTDKIIRFIGGATGADFYQTLGELYPAYMKLSKSCKIKKKLIAPDKHCEQFKEKFVIEKGNTMRTIKNWLYSPTYTIITREIVAIELYTTDVIVVQIHNKALAEASIHSFNALWKTATPYKKSLVTKRSKSKKKGTTSK